MLVPFWSNDVSILINKEYITQVWPQKQMGLEEKMNAISRLVILMTFLGLLITRSMKIVIIGVITLAILFSVYNLRKRNKESFTNVRTSNSNSNSGNSKKDTITLETLLKKDCHPTTKQNPFGNVLLTDIMDHPDRKSAAPSFNPDVYENINKVTKQQTQMLNPDLKNAQKELYGDLYDNYQFDTQMMQRFYTTANTRVCNDQGAFATYLYGNMPSGKSSGPDGALARVQDNYRYILI